ncbi:hypothetical protein MBLNU13_g04357t1 [Cladosporium sp. NU13]
MAARRSLGGGRVLGSGKNLAPPVTVKPQLRPSGALSPSSSSISLGSQTSSTPISTENEDITARVALDEHGTAQAAAAASSRMVCPICNDEMTTLLQLNRHIDDNHSNLEEVEQDEVKTWFKQQMTKAKKFQPLAVLNQKLRGLEVFEANDDRPAPSHSRQTSAVAAPVPSTVTPMPESSADPDVVVTQAHWQRATGFDTCLDPMCGKRLEKSGGKVAIDVRMCKDCQRTIFSKADFSRELASLPPDQRAYQNLLQFEHGIRLLLPRFQRLLLTLQDPEKPPSPAQLTDAAKVRKRLTDAFTQYDSASRRIRDMPTQSPTQARLQKAVHQQATNFLHVHMLPLKSLPKIMKHATPNGKPSPRAANGKPQSALAAIRYNEVSNSRPSSSRASSTSSAAVTALEAEEKELRERLIVLEEQKFFVSEMIADANKRRQFDEVSALSGNVEDLSREIDQIQGQLAQMDFAGAYAADGAIK